MHTAAKAALAVAAVLAVGGVALRRRRDTGRPERPREPSATERKLKALAAVGRDTARTWLAGTVAGVGAGAAVGTATTAVTGHVLGPWALLVGGSTGAIAINGAATTAGVGALGVGALRSGHALLTA